MKQKDNLQTLFFQMLWFEDKEQYEKAAAARDKIKQRKVCPGLYNISVARARKTIQFHQKVKAVI